MSQQQQLLLHLPSDLSSLMKQQLLDGGKQEIVGTKLIDVIPQEYANNYLFLFEGGKYPALLTNLPTILETHKTFDCKTYLKSGECGQILHVFHTEREREAMRSKLCKISTQGDYFAHGITPPTMDIVHRRFERTNKTITSTHFSPHIVKEVVNDICGQWDMDLDDKEAKEWKFEEVVDFEDWMVDSDNPFGISFQLSGTSWTTDVLSSLSSSSACAIILDHPEILQIQSEIDDDRNREEYEKAKQRIKDAENVLRTLQNSTAKISNNGDDVKMGDNYDDAIEGYVSTINHITNQPNFGDVQVMMKESMTKSPREDFDNIVLSDVKSNTAEILDDEENDEEDDEGWMHEI